MEAKFQLKQPRQTFEQSCLSEEELRHLSHPILAAPETDVRGTRRS